MSTKGDSQSTFNPSSTPMTLTTKPTTKSSGGVQKGSGPLGGSRSEAHFRNSTTPLPGQTRSNKSRSRWIKRLVTVPTIDGSFPAFMWVAEETRAASTPNSLHHPDSHVTVDFRPRQGVNPATQRPVYHVINTASTGVTPSPSPVPPESNNSSRSVTGGHTVNEGFKSIVRRGSVGGGPGEDKHEVVTGTAEKIKPEKLEKLDDTVTVKSTENNTSEVSILISQRINETDVPQTIATVETTAQSPPASQTNTTGSGLRDVKTEDSDVDMDI